MELLALNTITVASAAPMAVPVAEVPLATEDQFI